MLVTEQVQASKQVQVSNGLNQQKPQKRPYTDMSRPEEASQFTLIMAQDEEKRKERKKILDEVIKVEEKYKAPINSDTAGKMLDELLKIIESGCKEKVMFGMPYELAPGMLSDEKKEQALKAPSLIGHFIKNLDFVKKQIKEEKFPVTNKIKGKRFIIYNKISDLIEKGTYVSKEILELYSGLANSDLADLADKRNYYLSSLEKIVYHSIENDKKEGVVVERDGGFYSVQCPEGSVITPAKFMNASEFKDLGFGALRIGEKDDVIRLRGGQYHDMKGRITMTLNVGGKKLEMFLFPKKAHEPENNTLTFGTIMVYMDDKNCEIFNRHYETLKGQPRIEKIISQAKSFIEEKNGKQTEPFSVIEEVKASQCVDCGKHLG